MASRLFAFSALMLFVLAGPATARSSECSERVIEITRSPGKTTKVITEDGVEVFRKTWVKIGTSTKEIGPGWVNKRPAPVKTVPSAPPPTSKRSSSKMVSPSRARAVALGFVGVRHSPGGLDASRGLNTPGLAYAFHKKMGVEVPRQIASLYRAGDFVLKKDLRAGDMVFHHSDKKGRAAPNMVGINLGGGEMVYMSGSKRKVLKVDFESSWWEERYQGSRRVIATSHARPVGSSPKVAASKRLFEGIASFYGCGDGFDGSNTASGEKFDASKLTAAHFDLPLGTRLEVTNLANGKKVRVRVNDRGPFEKENGRWVRHSTRVVDLACRAAEVLGFKSRGLTKVRCRVLD